MIERQTIEAKRWADYPALLVVAVAAGLVCFFFSGNRNAFFQRLGQSESPDSVLQTQCQSGIGMKNIFPIREFFPYRPEKRQH